MVQISNTGQEVIPMATPGTDFTQQLHDEIEQTPEESFREGWPAGRMLWTIKRIPSTPYGMKLTPNGSSIR